MTSNPKLGWPVQNPSPDFAARTVTAILRDRDERREGEASLGGLRSKIERAVDGSSSPPPPR